MSIKIEDTYYDVQPRVGDTIYIDEWGAWADLIEDETGWEKCDYRIPIKGGFYELAVRIEVTGRTIQWRQGAPMVRIKIVFVGDGEPDKVCRGWAYVCFDRIDEAKWERYMEEQRRIEALQKAAAQAERLAAVLQASEPEPEPIAPARRSRAAALEL